MHEIKINHNELSLKIDRETIEYNGEKYEWMANSRIIFKDIEIDIKQKILEIEISNGKYKLIVVVEKSVNKLGVQHLDVSFKGIDYTRREGNMKKRYGGLIGDIGRKNISVMKNTVQEKEDVDVEIDKRFLSGKLEKRFANHCILLPIKQLIEPKHLNDYVYL